MRLVSENHPADDQQDDADEIEEIVDRKRHAFSPATLRVSAPSSRASLRSSSHSRKPWIRNAQIAVGMPHTATCIGSTTMPASFRNVTISTIAPNATKMSSPKNRPTLSVAAEYARSL